jgi:hypothetical protein
VNFAYFNLVGKYEETHSTTEEEKATKPASSTCSKTGREKARATAQKTTETTTRIKTARSLR